MASSLAARQTLNLARLSTSRSAPSLVQRRGFSAAADQHGAARVDCWKAPMSPSTWKEEHVLAVKVQGARNIAVSCSESKATVSYTEDSVVSNNGRLENTDSDEEEHANENLTSDPVDDVVAEGKKGAKIHDFCFGIPYGGFVLSWGLIGSIFSRNLSTLGNGMLFGGALLALSIYSLKVWRQGKSSIPFVLGQAVLSAVLLWKNIQSYTMTKKVFPIFVYAAVSAAMLCFYTYVVISGGNPPPKKLKSAEVASS